jgi:nucleotide-binding universal stress UspA family protein
MDTIRKILVPTDFSAHADEAFRVACTLARLSKAEVILFHVAHPPAVVSEDGKLLANPGEANSVNLWDRFQSIHPVDAAVRVEHQVIVADKARAGHVLEMLDKLGCDLIVMGTHGRSWLKHRLFGSVAEEVVRLARCPVMVVKAPASVGIPHQAEAATDQMRTEAKTGQGIAGDNP